MDTTTQAILLFGVPVILYFIYKFLTAPNNYWKNLGVPSVEETSIYESFLEVLNNKMHKTHNDRRKKYGRIYGFFEFIRPALVVTDPVHLRNIFVKDFDVFTGGRDMTLEGDIISDMLFSMKGEKWKRVRTILTPVFTTGKLKKMLPHISFCVKTLLKNLSGPAKKNEKVELIKFYEAFTMDLIASAAFATKIDSHNDPQNPFVVNARKVFSMKYPWRFALLAISMKLMKLLRIAVFDPKACKFFENVCKKIYDERKNMKGEKPNDFFQLMMDSSIDEAMKDDRMDEKPKISLNVNKASDKVLSSREITANSVLFFLAAFGPTSYTLLVSSFLLATNPDCQEKLIKEVDETLEKCNNELTYDSIQSMSYLEMFLSEAFRLYPIALRTERVASTDYTLENNGIKIPKGTLVMMPIYSIHRDPELYPDPEKFDPYRFTPEEKAKRSPYAYIPFGAGPRFCIAQRFALFEAKACLVYLLSQYRIKKCPETKVPLEFHSNVQGMLTPDKLLFKVEERTDKVLKDFY